MAAAVTGDGGSAQSAAPLALSSRSAATGRSRKRPARFSDGASVETSPEKSKREKAEQGGKTATRATSGRRGKPPLQKKDTALLAAPSADPPAHEVLQVDKVLNVRADDALLSWKGRGPGESQYVKFIDMAPPVSGRSHFFSFSLPLSASLSTLLFTFLSLPLFPLSLYLSLSLFPSSHPVPCLSLLAMPSVFKSRRAVHCAVEGGPGFSAASRLSYHPSTFSLASVTSGSKQSHLLQDGKRSPPSRCLLRGGRHNFRC